MNKDYKLNVSEIFASLCRHLSVSSDISTISAEFMGLDTNLERVNFAHVLLKKYGLFPEYDTKNWKNDQLSVKYRENGNEMFKDGKWEYALELYTKSVAYAKKESDCLGLAYGNRSAALYEKKMYKECLEDIDRALEFRHSKQLYDKLMRRQQNAKKPNSDEGKTCDDLPIFTHEPCPYISCAANCVAIKTSKDLGRHVIATKDIQIGDVIAIEKPFAAIILPESSINHCHNCLKVSYNLVPCDNCNYALFCNEICREQAVELYHKYECPIIEVLLSLQISKLTLLALRVAFCAKKDYNNIEKFPKTQSVYESGRYEEIHKLCTNTECRNNADLFDRALTSAIIYELVKKYTVFFDEFKDEKYHDLLKDILLHHTQTAPSNFHEISELAGSIDMTSESTEIGAGAYSFLSMINHSCSPNVVRHCYGTTIVLRALSPIANGQQIFDNYGYHYAVMHKHERQKNLKTQYFFDCNCEACEYNWPLYQYLPIKNFEFEVSEEDIANLQNGNVETANRILKGLLIKAAILEKMKPCKNLADIQECIKQCYSILGNKKFM